MPKIFEIPKKIESVQFLRFFAAMAVAFSHFGIVNEITDTVFNVTYFLRLFFVLSGFIVMLSTEQKEKSNCFFSQKINSFGTFILFINRFCVWGCAIFARVNRVRTKYRTTD